MKKIIYILLSGAFLLMQQTAFAQSKRTVSGTVVEANGDPIIGASIVEKGTKNGTLTNDQGAFSLTATDGSTLVVSFVGKTTMEVPANQANLSLTLQDDPQNLGEFVVKPNC